MRGHNLKRGRPDMYSRKLSYFLKICETGSLSRASEALYVSQQALSKAIDTL